MKDVRLDFNPLNRFYTILPLNRFYTPTLPRSAERGRKKKGEGVVHSCIQRFFRSFTVTVTITDRYRPLLDRFQFFLFFCD